MWASVTVLTLLSSFAKCTDAVNNRRLLSRWSRHSFYDRALDASFDDYYDYDFRGFTEREIDDFVENLSDDEVDYYYWKLMEEMNQALPDLSVLPEIPKVHNLFAAQPPQTQMLPCMPGTQNPHTGDCYGQMSITDFNSAVTDPTEQQQFIEGDQYLYVIVETAPGTAVVRYFDNTKMEEQKKAKGWNTIHFGHTSMLIGRRKATTGEFALAKKAATSPVVYAGTFKRTGTVVKFNNDSGHFKPNKEYIPQVAKLLGVVHDDDHWEGLFAHEMRSNMAFSPRLFYYDDV